MDSEHSDVLPSCVAPNLMANQTAVHTACTEDKSITYSPSVLAYYNLSCTLKHQT